MGVGVMISSHCHFIQWLEGNSYYLFIGKRAEIKLTVNKITSVGMRVFGLVSNGAKASGFITAFMIFFIALEEEVNASPQIVRLFPILAIGLGCL